MNTPLRFGRLLNWRVTSTTAVANSWTATAGGHQYDMARVSLARAREHDRRYYLRVDGEDGIGTFLAEVSRGVHLSRVAADIHAFAHPEDLVDHDEIPSLPRVRVHYDSLGNIVKWRGERLWLSTNGSRDTETVTVCRFMHHDSGWWTVSNEGEVPLATITAEFSHAGPPDRWKAVVTQKQIDDSETWHQAMRRVLDQLTALVNHGDLPANYLGEYAPV